MKIMVKLTSGSELELDEAEYPLVAFTELCRREEDISHRATIRIRGNGTDYVTYAAYHLHGVHVSMSAYAGIIGFAPYTAAEGLRNQLADAGFLRPFISRLIRDIALHPDLTKGELT